MAQGNHESVISLIVKAPGGAETVDQLRRSTANYKALLAQLPDEFRRGNVSAEQFTAEMKRLGTEYDRQAGLLRQMEAALEAEAQAARRAAEAQQTAAAAAAGAAGDVYELADAYELVEKEEERVVVQTRKLSDVFANIRVSTRDVNTWEAALGKAGRAADGAARSSADMGFAVLNAGRGIQDFAQGGFGGILNNIEMMTTSLGGTAGLAGALSAVGVAAYLVGPKLVDFGKGLLYGSNEIPPLTDKLKALEEQHRKNAKALDELREKQHLSDDELKRHNELVKEQAKLDAERDARELAKKVAGTTNAGQDARAREFNDLVKSLGGPDVSRDLKAILRRQNPFVPQEAIDSMAAAQMANFSRGTADFDRFKDNAFSAPDAQQTELEKAIVFGDRGKRAANAAAVAAMDKRDREEISKQRDARREANDKLVDMLVRQGQENEALMSADARARQEAEDRARQEAETAKFSEQVGRFRGTAEKGTIDEEAAAAAARYRAQGGYTDRRGRFQRLDERGQFDALVEDLRGELTKRTGQRGAVVDAAAMHMAGAAFGGVDEQTQVRNQQIAAANNGVGNKQLAASQVMLQTQEALMQEVARLGRQVDQLGRGAVQQNQRARTLLSRGRQSSG